MTPKRFLFISLLSFAIMLTTHAWIVDRLIIIDRELPYSYRQFLLETAAPIQGKVIIDSGSNSIYSINPFELSNYFNAPVITVSDNAAYPLRQKIFNLLKHTQAGDIVILPLEWGYYTRPNILPLFFINDLAGRDLRLEYYYNSMPWDERLRFIFTQYPLREVINGLKITYDRNILMRQDLERLSLFEERVKSNSYLSFGNLHDNGPKKIVEESRNNACDGYIYDSSFEVSNIFRANLKLLKILVDNGVRVYFTWPATADSKYSKCFQGEYRHYINKFADEVKTAVENEGFRFIGDYQQSHFSSNCFLNTYYHITGNCAITRTRTLINEIHKSKLPKVNSGVSQSDFISILTNKIHQSKIDFSIRLINQLPVVEPGNIKKIDIFKQILFVKGWSVPEKWGIWSSGKESIFKFRINKHQPDTKWVKLKIKGMYFNGEEKTGIIINGVSYGDHELNDKTFFIPANSISNNQIVDIRLKHTSVISPAELGVSNDPRGIKYGLTHIEVNQTHTKP